MYVLLCATIYDIFTRVFLTSSTDGWNFNTGEANLLQTGEANLLQPSIRLFAELPVPTTLPTGHFTTDFTAATDPEICSSRPDDPIGLETSITVDQSDGCRLATSGTLLRRPSSGTVLQV